MAAAVAAAIAIKSTDCALGPSPGCRQSGNANGVSRVHVDASGVETYFCSRAYHHRFTWPNCKRCLAKWSAHHNSGVIMYVYSNGWFLVSGTMLYPLCNHFAVHHKYTKTRNSRSFHQKLSQLVLSATLIKCMCVSVRYLCRPPSCIACPLVGVILQHHFPRLHAYFATFVRGRDERVHSKTGNKNTVHINCSTSQTQTEGYLYHSFR